MSVNRATLAKLKLEAKQVADELRAAEAQIDAVWGTAWVEVEQALRDAIAQLAAISVGGEWPSRTKVLRAQQVLRALRVVEQQAKQAVLGASPEVLARTRALALFAPEAFSQVAGSQLPSSAAVTFNRVDARAIDAIVTRATKRMTVAHRPLSGEARAAMRAALVRGVALGDNPEVAAARMLAHCRGVFDGGRWRARNIARTEMMDAYRASAAAARSANSDVVGGWRWMCSLSTRTCPACLVKHGTSYPAGAVGPEGHPSCRCTSVPTVKPWSNLGIDVDEPADQFPDAREWFNRLPSSVQRGMLGPSRFSAWRSGDLDWDDFAVRRNPSGWRPNWVTAPVS